MSGILHRDPDIIGTALEIFVSQFTDLWPLADYSLGLLGYSYWCATNVGLTDVKNAWLVFAVFLRKMYRPICVVPENDDKLYYIDAWFLSLPSEL